MADRAAETRSGTVRSGTVRSGTVLAGVTASGGLALGPCFRPSEAAAAADAPPADAADFAAALARAATELRRLMAREERLAAEILEFQSALLEDDDLLAPVRARIAGGIPADLAWRGVLDAEIADYRAAEDEYMAARASDLADLRDRVLRALRGAPVAPAPAPEGAILVAADLTPTAFLEQDWTRLAGAALGGGSATSHVALLARARGVPMVVGLGDLSALADATPLALDADRAEVLVAPDEATRAAIRTRIAALRDEAARASEAARLPARTAAGQPVRIMVNADDPALLATTDPAICDGIGLTRTEFLFADGLPGEDAQAAAYEGLVRWAAGRPVTIRTLDAGGDKPVPGLSQPEEANPFLGLRGLRLSLRHPEAFRTQLRAIARAARLGPVKAMLPMVTVPAELEAARVHLDTAIAELEESGTPHARPALGIMVETPAAALTAESFDADFYSIGSNDLTQYVTAAARDNPALAPLADPLNPAVLELIGRTVAAGRARGVEVSLCGDMASRPECIAALIGLGLDTLSVAPATVGAVKLAVAETGARGNRQEGDPA